MDQPLSVEEVSQTRTMLNWWRQNRAAIEEFVNKASQREDSRRRVQKAAEKGFYGDGKGPLPKSTQP